MASAIDVRNLPTLPPNVLPPLAVESRDIPTFDFGDCVAKVSEGCRLSGYPQCTEWSVAICRDELPPRFAGCFESVSESCRKDSLPSCPNYALTQCKQ